MVEQYCQAWLLCLLLPHNHYKSCGQEQRPKRGIWERTVLKINCIMNTHLKLHASRTRANSLPKKSLLCEFSYSSSAFIPSYMAMYLLAIYPLSFSLHCIPSFRKDTFVFPRGSNVVVCEQSLMSKVCKTELATTT